MEDVIVLKTQEISLLNTIIVEYGFNHIAKQITDKKTANKKVADNLKK